MERLRLAWHDLLPDADGLGAELLRRWAEPQRHYHDTEHLAEVLDAIDAIDTIGTADTIGDGAPSTVRLAAWFHDAVYEPTRADNEHRSAALARTTLPAAGVAPTEVAEVVRLVRLTATHDPAPGDSAGELLCDADLAILGATPERYERYVGDVRREYEHVPGPAFRAARDGILRGFLDRTQIYRTDAARARWETAARRNLGAELSAGSGGDAGRRP